MEIKTIKVTGDNLDNTIFTLEVSENYFQKYDKVKDITTGLEFIVVDRPYRTIRGHWEIRCKLLTKATLLRFKENTYLEEYYKNDCPKINDNEEKRT